MIRINQLLDELEKTANKNAQTLSEGIDQLFLYYGLCLCKAKLTGESQKESKEGIKRVQNLLKEQINK
ncbi:hypothetical protein NUSPORA_02624 [Nucleospora cyclopteri]